MQAKYLHQRNFALLKLGAPLPFLPDVRVLKSKRANRFKSVSRRRQFHTLARASPFTPCSVASFYVSKLNGTAENMTVIFYHSFEWPGLHLSFSIPHHESLLKVPGWPQIPFLSIEAPVLVAPDGERSIPSQLELVSYRWDTISSSL